MLSAVTGPIKKNIQTTNIKNFCVVWVLTVLKNIMIYDVISKSQNQSPNSVTKRQIADSGHEMANSAFLRHVTRATRVRSVTELEIGRFVFCVE
jgi:hypothetical protein